MNVIFLGPPGSGKGTMAVRVGKELGLAHISTGDMLRAEMKAGSELGKSAKSYIDKGALVPDSVIIGMMGERMKADDAKGGVLLDGFPRTVAQAEALDGIATIDAVINLEVDVQVIVDRVLAHVPGATLRTTLIAGFPGETEEQFEDLCSFVEEGLFDYVGVFPYSREEGTRAFDLPGQLDEDEKNDRAQRLRDLADAVCCPRIAARVGREMDVLVEGVEEDGQLFGRAMCQAPEVDGVTYLDAGEPGEIRRVRIVDALLYEMEGE